MKRSMKQRFVTWMLLLCTIATLLPVASPPAKAKAASSTTQTVPWKGELRQVGTSGDHTISLDEENNLIVEGRYFSNSKATLSYHTAALYLTDGDTHGNPGGYKGERAKVNVKHTSVPSSEPNEAIDTFIIKAVDLQTAIEKLYGKDALRDTNTVWISEVFVLKTRANPNSDWKPQGKQFESLEAIRNAANWSSKTWDNFEMYYDSSVSLCLANYTVTVLAEEGGTANGGSERSFKGDTININAYPDDGYTFKGWETDSPVPGLTLTQAKTSFTMPSSDVTLTAVFEKERTPEPTKKPVATPKPGDPTPTPMPTPTLAPTPTPPLPEPGETYGQNIWYYSTDQGYTIKGIHDQDGPLANMGSATGGGSIRSNEYTALDAYYPTGRDSAGNTWYFLPDGDDAIFVHPAVYQGKDINTSQVKDIRELVFPETITYGGKSYTVRGIGGGTDKYHSYAHRSNSAGNTYTGYTLDKASGSYYYGSSGSSVSGGRETFQSISQDAGYHYGVAGNGEITSSGSVHFDFFQDGEASYRYNDYESSYYVYNTTLEFITIPDTVTEIHDYAFCRCQGLRKITGAGGIKYIGKYAFAGASVLTTETSVEESGNYRRYYYNESYSTGIPTDTMRSWQSAVALREYMELAAFTVLDTICEYAFAYRKNLFDVKLPEGVSMIKDNAFCRSGLNTITIPGKNTVIKDTCKDTLGTKGNPDTIIITVPESEAMYYGLRYEDYYTLRCGHPVTYDKNALPAEEYTTASMLEVLKKEIKDSFSGNITSHGSSGSTYTSGSYEMVLDTEGTLWLKKGSALFPSEVMPGTKFTDIRKVTLSEKNSYNEKSTGYCFAFAENGKVYLYDPAGTWKDTGMPAGSRGHRWACSTVKEQASEESSSGYSSYASGTIKIHYLYYLDGDGTPHRKEMYRTTETGCGGSSYDGTSYSTAYSFRTGTAAETLPVPEGVAFRSLYATGIREGSIETSASWGDGYSSSTKKYSLYLPDVYAEDTDGNLWHASGGNPGQKDYHSGGYSETTPGYLDAERTDRVLPVSYYTWEREDGIRQVSGEFEESGTRYLHVLDADGDLLLYRNPQDAQSPWQTPNLLGRGQEYTVLSGKGFVSMEVVSEDFALLTGADGSTWVYLYRNIPSGYGYPPHKPVRLPDGVRVKAWRESYNSHYGEDGHWDEDTSYSHYLLFLLDDTGRLWRYKETKETRYRPDGPPDIYWNSPSLLHMLTGVEDMYVPEDTGGGPVLIRDNDGEVWEYACGRVRGEYLYYSYPDGRLEKITGEEAVADARQKLGKTAYSVGYEFVETLYANMFSRPGYRFVSWNTEASGSGISLRPGERLPVSAPVTLYAQWERTKNIIRYAPNGGSGIMEDDMYEPGVIRVTLKKNVYTKNGCEFAGWNTEADGSGTPYGDKASFAIPQGTTVLYAQWKPYSYTVKVAGDDVRVTPVTITDTRTLTYDQTITIPAALADREYTVSYDLNPEGGAPYWITELPLTERYTKARLSFSGWRLYEETPSGYHFLDTYGPGQEVKNLATEKNAVLVLFPYWSGDASYVDLPVAGCTGYDMAGWSEKRGETDPSKIIYASEGNPSQYQPAGNVTLYANWMPAVTYVRLDDRGATSTDHTPGVLLTYGEAGPDIIVPEKEGYTFQGYYMGIRGGGKRYYDTEGKFLGTWQETADVLYACWEQDPEPVPTLVPTPAVTAPVARDPVNVSIRKTPSLTFSCTGYDTNRAVPSTESGKAVLSAGSYTFSATLRERTGVKDITVHVKVPYITRYEDPDTEELKDSAVQYAEYDIPVRKAYSYWEAEDGVFRVAEEGMVSSGAFAERLVFPFSVTPVDCTVRRYTAGEHAPGTGITLVYGETVCISGTEPGSAPSAEKIRDLTCIYAKNHAWSGAVQPVVKSDAVILAGKTILSDAADGSGKGAEPDTAVCDDLAAGIPEVRSEVSVDFAVSARNGIYPMTETSLRYEPYGMTGGAETLTEFSADTVTIHTPVVSSPDRRTLYQDGEGDGITIDDYAEFLHMDLSRLMYGTHIQETGYGTRDYTSTVSGREPFDSILLDATVPLYFDIKQDSSVTPDIRTGTGDDIRFGEGEVIRFRREGGVWYLAAPDGREAVVRIEDLSVYVLATECTSDFEVTYGVLAANGKDFATEYDYSLEGYVPSTEYKRLFEEITSPTMLYDFIQEGANLGRRAHFAYRTVSYDVTYRYITFRFYDTQEKVAKVSPDGMSVATKQGYEAYFYVTQPEGFDGTVEVLPEFSLVDTEGNLVSDDILVLYRDYREGLLGDMRRYEGITPADDTVIQDFHTNWLKVPGIKWRGMSQTWTFNGVWMNGLSLMDRDVDGTVLPARHGAYRLPNQIRVLEKKDVPETPVSTKEEFLTDYRARDRVLQSDLVLPFADSGYLKVELDVSLINADGTVLAGHGTIPPLCLYYTIGDTGEGLYYRHNGIIPEGDGMDDDVEVDYVHVRKVPAQEIK